MKYEILKQITNFLSNYKKITEIKRVDDNAILIEFDRNLSIIFDLNKGKSRIYLSQKSLDIKIYKAPFDTILKKRFSSSKITEISTLENNRIIKIKASFLGSYKELKSILYLEFTGRFTNAIITDENGLILEALRHFDNDFRSIRVGKILKELPNFQIKEKPSAKITDLREFLEQEAQNFTNEKLNLIKANKLAQIEKKLAAISENLANLQNENELESLILQMSKQALAITSNLYNLNDFDRNFKLEFEGEILSFNLDKNPKIHANELFIEIKKLKQKVRNLHIQRENLQEKFEFLSGLKRSVENENNINNIEILLPKKSQKQEKNSDLVCNFYLDNYKISLGKNEKGNIFLLKNAKKDDFWFHLKDKASAHLIVKTNKQNLSDEITEFCANLVVSFSTKFAGNYLVDYTQKRNLKISEGANLTYNIYKTISVKRT